MVAQLLDGVMYLLAALPGAGLGAFLGSSVEFPKDDGGVQSGAAIFAMGLAGVTCSVLYIYQCFLIANSGQSLGKRWSHVRIVLEDGQPPGFGKGIVLRSWVLILLRLIPFVGSVVSLVDTLMIFSDGHRCLHDRIAGTRVVVAD